MVQQGLELELAAMQDIATTLGRLEPSQRARVLQWLTARFTDEANIRFTAAPAATAAAAPILRIVPPPASESDELLSVETLEQLFDPHAPTPPPASDSVRGMLTEFVAEFQEIAREWNDACEAPPDVRQPARVLSAAS